MGELCLVKHAFQKRRPKWQFSPAFYLLEECSSASWFNLCSFPKSDRLSYTQCGTVLKGLSSSQTWINRNGGTVNILTFILRCHAFLHWIQWEQSNGRTCTFVFPKPQLSSDHFFSLHHLFSFLLWAFIFSFQDNKCCLLSRNIGLGRNTAGCFPERAWESVLCYFTLYLLCSKKKAQRQEWHGSLNLTATFM